ncbi:sulfite oxidase [Desulfosarcina alkanivorans]|uniref:Sulfite oxidase n=2 Tax=Desulfosarcina alkanivorans TaxID=571177 RepID=A0A5K7YMC0_9BACT|nr:sulfite oxidase [Desulfosarcina alkanivorans]
MTTSMRIMTDNPLNAETPAARLRSWITPNAVFFDRNQGQIPDAPADLDTWRLTIDGDVNQSLKLDLDRIQSLPKAIVANTLECSGNSRSLLEKRAPGNPWTIGGVGNAVWGGIWLRDLLNKSGLADRAAHVAFEGMDTPLGKSRIKFVRSIPIEKAMSSTLLAYEMNGDPLPLKHGYPLRALALGWTGANCVKWLNRITVLERPFKGFFMDQVYRVFQKGQMPASGEVVTAIRLNSIITRPLAGERLKKGDVVVLGAAYAGEGRVAQVDVSTDHGASWQPAEFIGPDEPYAWRQWQYVWRPDRGGDHTLWSRAVDDQGGQQPMSATWNFLGYGNNGVDEHAVRVVVT